MESTTTQTAKASDISYIDNRTGVRYSAYLGKSGASVGYGFTKKDAKADLIEKLAARGIKVVR